MFCYYTTRVNGCRGQKVVRRCLRPRCRGGRCVSRRWLTVSAAARVHRVAPVATAQLQRGRSGPTIHQRSLLRITRHHAIPRLLDAGLGATRFTKVVSLPVQSHKSESTPHWAPIQSNRGCPPPEERMLAPGLSLHSIQLKCKNRIRETSEQSTSSWSLSLSLGRPCQMG